jgi:hypothetical protein
MCCYGPGGCKEESKMDTRENLKAGKYKTKLAYPDRNVYSKEEFRALRTAWQRDNQRLEHDVLKADLFEEWKVSGPKAEKLWERSWDRGHADGLHQVIWEFEDLVELILP